MVKTFSSIHIINADIEEVRSRLAYCQMYANEFKPEKLDILKNQMDNMQNTLLKAIQVVKFINKQKEHNIRFYSIERGHNISIFSEYITFDNVFEIAKEFFADLDNYILSLGMIDTKSFRIDVIKNGNKITSLTCDASNEKKETMDFNYQVLKKSGLLSDVSDLKKILNMNFDEMIRKIESLLELPLTLNINDIDTNSSNVYIDDYVIV